MTITAITVKAIPALAPADSDDEASDGADLKRNTKANEDVLNESAKRQR